MILKGDVRPPFTLLYERIFAMEFEKLNAYVNRATFPYKDIYTTVYTVKTEDGYLLFDGEKAYLSTSAEGKVELELPAPAALPIERFIKGEEAPGCGMAEAIVLTRMMEGAYGAR